AAQAPDIDVHDVIQSHRRWVVELMQHYTAVKADATADDVALALVVDAELFRLEGAVRWLDTADVRLGRQRPSVRAPAPASAPASAPGEDRAGSPAAARGVRR